MEKSLDDDEDRFDAVLSIPEDRKIKENFDRDVTVSYTHLDVYKRQQINSLMMSVGSMVRLLLEMQTWKQ